MNLVLRDSQNNSRQKALAEGLRERLTAEGMPVNEITICNNLNGFSVETKLLDLAGEKPRIISGSVYLQRGGDGREQLYAIDDFVAMLVNQAKVTP